MYLTCEVMKLKVTDDGLHLGVRGVLLSVAVFTVLFGAGIIGAQQSTLFTHEAENVRLIAQLLGMLFSAWSVILLWHVKRDFRSLTRLLSWTGVVGVVLGYLFATGLA